MTPSGVEQKHGVADDDRAVVVIETMTPSGVEQFYTTLTQGIVLGVIETMTPSGVERSRVIGSPATSLR